MAFSAPRLIAMGLLAFFCSATNAILTPASIIYTIMTSPLYFFREECMVLRFREPNTAFTMAKTDGYSEYLYVAFPTDRVVKIEASLPFALYSVYTTYTGDSKQIDALLDSDIVLDDGSPNPYITGNPINSQDRSFTLYASNERPDFATTNWMSTDSGEREHISIFMMRVVGEYGDAEGLSSREWVPSVTLLDQEGNQERCNLLMDQGRLPWLTDTYTAPNIGPDGDCHEHDAPFEGDVFPDFSFFPVPEKERALQNTANGGYLRAQLEYSAEDNEDMQAFVIEYKDPPRVYSPGASNEIDMDEQFNEEAFDVRYTSLCLYQNLVSAPRDGINCITGVDIYEAYEKHGVAYIAGGDPSLEQQFADKGIPFLSFTGSDFGAEGLKRLPFFVLRTQLPNSPEYDVDLNVPRWDHRCDEKLTNGFYKADNENNLGDKAPVGRQCSSENLVKSACGFEGLDSIINVGGIRG